MDLTTLIASILHAESLRSIKGLDSKKQTQTENNWNLNYQLRLSLKMKFQLTIDFS